MPKFKRGDRVTFKDRPRHEVFVVDGYRIPATAGRVCYHSEYSPGVMYETNDGQLVAVHDIDTLVAEVIETVRCGEDDIHAAVKSAIQEFTK